MKAQHEQWCGGSPWQRGGPPHRQPWVTRQTGGRMPWISTLAVTVFVQIGSGFAPQGQLDRPSLDVFARVLLLTETAFSLLRHRYPVLVVFAASAAAMTYQGAGYPYGSVFVPVVMGCFSAIVAGHRRAAWTALGMLWAGHVLVSHWLYRWLPPAGDGVAPWGQELVVAA